MTDSSERKERPQSGMEIVRRPSNPHACARDEATENDREEHAALDSVDPDEVLFPDPFHEPADFAPISAPQARLADVLELAGHIAFVLLITIVIPLAILWAGYRLYRWLPFETMALAIVSAGALWSYRDRLGPRVRRLLLGTKPR